MKLLGVILLAGFAAQAASQASEFAMGRAYYADGEFRKAAAHFQLALQAEPCNAGSYYWLGMSYQKMADIATPFGGKYTSKARGYLIKAVELAPDRADYRQELFNLLLDSVSRASLRQASDILQTESDSDPERAELARRLADAGKVNSSADARLGAIFLAAPRVSYEIAALPLSALSGRPRNFGSCPNTFGQALVMARTPDR